MKQYKLNSFTGLKWLLLGVALSVSGCDRGGDGVPQPDPDFVEVDDPDRFLTFLNRQAGAPAGRYRIVAGTFAGGETGAFTILIDRDDGRQRGYKGNWNGSGGMDETSLDNPAFDFEMPYSGGIRIRIFSEVDTCLYLLDPGGTVIAGQQGADLCTRPDEIRLPASYINRSANAKAYYRAIDPNGTRRTLEDWKRANHFGEPCGAIDPCETHVIFRDTKDLGYGRSMYARRNDDGSFAVYVENFQVDAVPGQQYTSLNLDAAVADDRRWHFGTNAIEFSTYPYGSGEPRNPGGLKTFDTAGGGAPLFAKFYTFRPDEPADPNTTERRLRVVDLDNRGGKSMPGPCIVCHGGKSRPRLPSGDLPPPIPGGVAGDLQAQMQVIEVNSVGFSNEPGHTCSEIISGIHFINQGVLDTYRVIAEQYDGVAGYWQPDFAAELIKGWYDGDVGDPDDYTIPDRSCGRLQDSFDDYVPSGWRPDPSDGMPPAGADDLFREVIAPHCMVCHARRGTDLGPDQNSTRGPGQDIDFSTYEKFISHAEQIEQYIYDKGVMPLGLLNFDLFWDESSPGRAELLASHLPGFEDTGGKVRRPGRPVAVAAAPRNTNVPVTLSAEGSAFAKHYRWRVVDSVAGSQTRLTGAGTARPVFDTDRNGNYRLQLEVADGDGNKDRTTVDISVSSVLPRPGDLRFESGMTAGENIKTVLQDDAGPNCDSCHSVGQLESRAGVPLYYTDSQPEGRDLYREVRQRINFEEPLESKLLRKPAGYHHFGECREGFDLTATVGDCNGGNGDRSNYDLFLNWILQGAPR